MNTYRLRDLILESFPELELEAIETTTERNGYPANLRGAVIGFKSFDELNKVVSKFGGEPMIFTRKDGWQLWCALNPASEEFELDYQFVEKCYDCTFDMFNSKNELEDEIANSLNTFKEEWPEDEYEEAKERLYAELKRIPCFESNKCLVFSCSPGRERDWELLDKRFMSYYNDTNHYAIGLDLRDNDYQEE